MGGPHQATQVRLPSAYRVSHTPCHRWFGWLPRDIELKLANRRIPRSYLSCWVAPSHTPRMRGRISFDSRTTTFEAEGQKKREVAAIIRRWERMGVPLERLLIALWLYSCAPSKKELQAVLFASDDQTAGLRLLVLDAANQIIFPGGMAGTPLSADWAATCIGLSCRRNLAEREGFEPSIQVLARITV